MAASATCWLPRRSGRSRTSAHSSVAARPGNGLVCSMIGCRQATLAPNASRSSAPATSNTASRAPASAVARQAQAVVKALLLTRASPSFSATSKPLRVMSPWARSAIGPRSPWPIEPSLRTGGANPSLSSVTIISASSGRTPVTPLA